MRHLTYVRYSSARSYFGSSVGMSSVAKRFEGRIGTVGADGAVRPKGDQKSGPGQAFQSSNNARKAQTQEASALVERFDIEAYSGLSSK